MFRLLSHPRFRAAFDFLSIRQAASPEHAEDIAFWREAQTQSGDELAAQLDAQASAPDDDDLDADGAPRRRRRRRRNRAG